MNLPNAYPGHHSDKIKLTGMVSKEDYIFLTSLIPFCNGRNDHIVSTLVKALLTHLRHVTESTPIEPAWNTAHPTFMLVRIALDQCRFDDAGAATNTDPAPPPDQRDAVGRTPGPSPGGDEPGGTDSVCPEVQCAEIERSDQKSNTGEGGGRDYEEEVRLLRQQRLPRNGVAGSD